MKRMKKILAVLLAAIMVMSLGTSVFADDDTYTLTVNGNTGHTITAYQLFSGDVNDDADTLSNIEWGSAFSTETLQSSLLTALSTANNNSNSALNGQLSGISTGSTASQVASAIASLTGDDKLQALAEVIYGVITSQSITGEALTESTGDDAGKYTKTGLSGGYYLVYDAIPTDSTATGDSAMKYILRIVGDTTVDDKTTGAPTIEKTITSDNVIGNGESNTAYFGDTVEYQITVTVPDTILQYDSYALTVYDALSSGLTLSDDFTSNGVTVTVYTDSQTVGTDTGTTVSTAYTVSTDSTTIGSNNDFAVIFNDILSLKDSGDSDITISSGYKIVITYSATVSASASTGTTANTNETYATYSNDPKSTSTGTTVTDTTYTYITSLEVTKTDGENNGLADAEFSLYKAVAANYKYDASASTNYVSTDTVKYYAYDSSSKTMVEITSEKASTLATDEITVYIQIDDEKEAEETTENSGTYVAKFGDLSAGDYVLIETTTPDGYNTADPVLFTISASTSENGSVVTWSVSNTSAENAVSVNDDGVYKTTVVNNAGSELPSTGGIGTTIFYIIGAILVLGAGVILITRRRMASR